MESGDAELLAANSDILGGKHRSVGRRLVSVSLDLHTSGHSHDSLSTRQVSDVDEGVVETCEDVSSCETLSGHFNNTLSRHVSGVIFESDIKHLVIKYIKKGVFDYFQTATDQDRFFHSASQLFSGIRMDTQSTFGFSELSHTIPHIYSRS